MIEPFALERFFAPYEFSARHVLCASDCETTTVGELLELDRELATGFLERRLTYSPMEGLAELREAIADVHAGIDASQILVVPGGGSALDLTFRALLGSGDHVVVLTPCYQSHSSLPRLLGCEVSEVALDEQPGGWHLPLERLEQAVRPSTRAMVVNFPHNPTGYLPDRATFQAIVAIAERSGAHLVSDEAFRLMEHDRDDRLPAGVEIYERGITIGTMSKAFGLPGLRIGWMISRRSDLIQGALQWNDYSAKDASAPSQLLATIAVRHRARLLERNRELALQNLVALEGFFLRHAQRFRWSVPKAGVVAAARLRAGAAKQLCDALFESTGVLLAPGEMFAMDPAYFRIGFGYRDFGAGLALFEEHLATLMDAAV